MFAVKVNNLHFPSLIHTDGAIAHISNITQFIQTLINQRHRLSSISSESWIIPPCTDAWYPHQHHKIIISWQFLTSWQLPSCSAPHSSSAAVWDKLWSWRYRSAGFWRRWGPAPSYCRPAAACRLPPASVSQSQAFLVYRWSSANIRKDEFVSGQHKYSTFHTMDIGGGDKHDESEEALEYFCE